MGSGIHGENTEMSGHISFYPNYGKWLLEQRDRAQIELIEFTKNGMRDPQKYGFCQENLESLLIALKRATVLYRSHLESVLGYDESRFQVECNDTNLIDRVLYDIEMDPEMSIGTVFTEIINKLVHPDSEFKRQMTNLFEHMKEMEHVDFTRPLNAQTIQRKHNNRGLKKRRNNY